MPKFDCIIRNGRVFLDASQKLVCTDLGIKNGKIVAIKTGLVNDHDNSEEINAQGLIVLPGGIDSHCHIEQRTSTGLTPCDNFYSASVSALCGGTTLFIPFACQHRGQRIRDVVSDYRKAAAKSAIDYAFHIIVSDPSEPHALSDLSELFQEGITSVKVYMTYDALKLSDSDLIELLALCRRNGALVMVHAESHDMIAWLTKRLLDSGHIHPKYHATARHPIAEREATHRAISFAELIDTPVLIVHVSGTEAATEILRGRKRGAPIFGETCPQYLTLTKECLEHEDEGAKYLCSPPLRDKASQEALWEGLRQGSLQVVSSDHSAYRFSDKGDGQASKQIFGKSAPFSKIPMGLPGLETRLLLVFNGGVNEERFGPRNTATGELCSTSIQTFVKVTSTNPSKLYGLYPRKGAIAVGSDADLTLWNPDIDAIISKSSGFLHDDLDYTPYEGMHVKGLPIYTISRGKVVFHRDCSKHIVRAKEIFASEGRGEWCASGRPDLLGWTANNGISWPNAQDPALVLAGISSRKKRRL